MKRYNVINNTLGWLAFLIAAATYLLTVEPTASFWDCPEFITQGFKLEVGHPPGNPIFMLTARFFVTLFGGSATSAALAVNCMSALLSAGTILLLFWTVTHLVRKLTVKDGEAPSAVQTLVIMAAGMCGALAYTWSDTFWFSAVEGEVYAFSSFCTALVFWLILKWENRADEPHSDRYLVFIAYIIGISIAVHLLNLLCIPAIVLVVYYKKTAHATVKGSLLALALSAVIVFFILYGLVPGFIKVAGWFELLFVNSFGASYNTGVVVYTALTLGVFVWTVAQLYRQQSPGRIKLGILLTVALSGMACVGSSAWIPVLLLAGLAIWLWGFCKKVPVRVLNVLVLSVMVIFIGYSSYALLLIRASADTPMNQNSPDNVFELASYLNRDQYGQRPLFYGPVVAEELDLVELGTDQEGNTVMGVEVDAAGMPQTRPLRAVLYDEGMPVDIGTDTYAKVVKTSPEQPDQYVREKHTVDYEYSNDVKQLLTRTYSADPKHVRNYKSWSEYSNPDLSAIPLEVRSKWAQQGYALESEIRPYLNNQVTVSLGTKGAGTEETVQAWKFGFTDNLRFFLNYQLNHMYWRYFMWNFAGRQNDMAGNGEPHLGNWISGIPAIDNVRLGDQSALPDEYGKGNPGHNVFYMLPLLLGLIGLLWQALANHKANPGRGIEQFWVIFFLFVMTGVAIVLYLNQPPCQPRERDYAFAGSFYAFAIWIGLGVPAVAAGLRWLVAKIAKKNASLPAQWGIAGVAAAIGLAVPLQMVSQTWDDHDRSNRYTTRDFGMNYLNSLDKNAVIFTYGDNDTFPLWYAQEVEGERTDVRVVNLSYLETDWYANQIRKPAYDGPGVEMYARPQDYAYGRFYVQRITDMNDSLALLPRPASVALPEFYNGTAASLKRLMAKYGLSAEESRNLLTDGNIYAPLDSASTMAAFGRWPELADAEHGGAYMDLLIDKFPRQTGQSGGLTMDIIANAASNGWKRPVYFASTVPTNNYLQFGPYLYSTGMAKQVTPFYNSATSPVAAKGYRNITERFRWGGLDQGKKIYLDETVRRMVSSTRLAVMDVAEDLLKEPSRAASAQAREHARKTGRPEPRTQADMARELLVLMDSKIPASAAPYEAMLDLQLAELYARLWALGGNPDDLKRAEALNAAMVKRYGQLVKYASTLSASERSRLGTDRQGLNYLIMAVGFQNYLDLRQAMVRANAPAEELQTLDGTFGINRGYEPYKYLYLGGITAEQAQELAQDPYYYGVAADILTLRDLHSRYAVNPQKRTRQAGDAAGITVENWRRVTPTGF